ncbi:MAG TPA: TRAP transporter permease [Desulfobacterales bacterium]|jgi:TRAP transporter 4TM/12TM fusion protein|nr:TRAP transporter permease [Desulfobacterales bacterium]HSM89763.1 TRAP transporter permease [Desulfobacterales bacterium]
MEETIVRDEALVKKAEEIIQEQEFGGRRLSGIPYKITFLIAIAFSCFQLYTAFFGVLTSTLQRSIHLTFAILLCFLFYPFSKKSKRKTIHFLDFVLAMVAGASIIYVTLYYEELVKRIGDPTSLDLAMGVLAIVLILEASRRAVGWPLVIITGLFIIYGLYGNYFPGILAHRGYSFRRIVDHLYLTSEGIFGIPLWVSSTFVYAFVLFGAIIERTGAGEYLMKIAMSLVGHTRGGPAKVSVVASAFMGTFSGSGIANTATIGTLTIPLMKKVGFKPELAGGIDTAAGGNGQIMPPVMGAAAFVMAEFLGIPYLDVCVAAALPAVIDQLALLGAVHLLATKYGFKGVPRAQLPKFFPTLVSGLHLLVPILVLLYALVIQRLTPLTSAAMAIGAASTIFLFRGLLISAGIIRVETTAGAPAAAKSWEPMQDCVRKMIDAMFNAGRSMSAIGVTCACAGMVVGMVSLTGAGLNMTNILVEFSFGNVYLAMILTMLACLLLGMGVPTTPNYVIMATIMAPALIALKPDTPLIAAHLFVFYFGILADGTPPVCLAAYAAAGIAGADPFKTGLESFKLDMRTFLLPYMFITAPQMLLIGLAPGIMGVLEASWIFITASLGMYALAGGMQGFFIDDDTWYERILLLAVALCLVKPGLYTDIIGLIGFALIYYVQKRRVGARVAVTA